MPEQSKSKDKTDSEAEPSQPNGASDIVRRKPDSENAYFALTVAADLLGSAQSKMGLKDYAGSLVDSKNCIRMSASALLYKDGYVAGTFESTLFYLEKNYAGMFPLEDWKIIENMTPEEKGGLFEAISKALGIKKKQGANFGTEKENAETAARVAEKFVLTVRYIFEAHIEEEMAEEGKPE